MGDPVPLAAADNAGRRRRFLMAAGSAVLVVALGLGFLAMIPGVLRSAGSQDPNRLTTVLLRTIETDGIEAAAAEYRSLRAQRFPRFQESESDTNRLGYALLQKGQTANAIEIFQLNVETHPRSANVYDSLGEAYLAAGNRPLAIANYEKALAIAPTMKSALSAIDDLTGRKRPPYRPLLLFQLVLPGQPQFFPVAVRNSGVLAVPTLLVILSLGCWLFRVNGFRSSVVASKRQPVVREAAAR